VSSGVHHPVLRARKAALEEELEMLKLEHQALLTMCDESSAELLKLTTNDDMPTDACSVAEAEAS
jgi:hypothetical protein